MHNYQQGTGTLEILGVVLVEPVLKLFFIAMCRDIFVLIIYYYSYFFKYLCQNCGGESSSSSTDNVLMSGSSSALQGDMNSGGSVGNNATSGGVLDNISGHNENISANVTVETTQNNQPRYGFLSVFSVSDCVIFN